MTKELEALKLALEALEQSQTKAPFGTDRVVYWQGVEIHEAAIAAVKEALARPDAFEQGRQEGMKQERALWTLTKLGQEIEAQPAQRPWVGLTDEEMLIATTPNKTRHWVVCATEAKLKEKNT
jgi:hypothetical protein